MNSCTTGACCIILAGLLQGCTAGPTRSAVPEYAPGAGYHQIMAEIAVDRGAAAAAAEEYLRAAERSDDPQFSERAVQFAFEYGFDTYALRGARRWARLAPDSAPAHLYLVRLLLRRNEVDAAVAEAQLALGPPSERTGEDYTLLAEELAGEGNSEGVTRLWSRIAARTPDSAAVRLALAAAALRSDDIDLAEASARLAITQGAANPALDQAHIVIARVLLARGETDAAIDHLGQQASLRPSLELELEYAAAMAAADRSAEALQRLEEIAGRHGNEPQVRRLRALVFLSTNDLEAAREEFNTLVDDTDYADESRFQLAEIAGRDGRFDIALKMLGRVGEGPYLLPAQESIARIAEASGDEQSALEILTRLADNHPERAFDIARVRAGTLQRLGRNDEAIAVLDEILRYRPDDADVLLIRGALFEKLQRIEPALADMEAAVRLFPEAGVTNNAFGYTLANRTRRLPEAYRHVRRALEREPGNAAILDSYGWVLYRQGRLAESRSYLQFAYAQLQDPELAAHLGEVMWKQGERDAARALWADALEKSPGNEPLTQTMARFIR